MNSFLAKIYTYKLFDDLVFIYPLYAVMFVESGITPTQIGVLFVVWSATAVALEVPSGVIADKYSRKHILFFAQLTRIAGYLTWLLFPTFPGFVAGFVLWGIKSAFTSGTFDALVFDELKAHSKEAEYTKVVGRARSLALIGTLIATAGAAAAITYGYGVVLVLSMLSLAVSALAVILLPAARKVESTHEQEYFALLRAGLAASVQDVRLFRLIIFISLALALSGALDEFWSIFGEQAGLEKPAIAIFLGVMSGALAIASAVAYRFRGLSNRLIYAVFALNGLILVAAGLWFAPAAALLVIVFNCLFKMIDVVYDGKFQAAIPSGQRATVSSVKGFLVEVIAILVYLLFGVIADVSSYQVSFTTFGAITAAVGLGYALTTFRKKVAAEAG